MQLSAYCLNWHIQTSPAFQHLLTKPLAEYASIKLVGWDGDKFPFDYPLNEPIVFCQAPPPANLLHNSQAKLVWIPMWDQACGYSIQWWNELPKSLRVVAFSAEIEKKARQAGLPTLRLKYFLNPENVPATTWDRGKVVFYWNRVGMIGPGFLRRMCANLEIDRLLFRCQLDPAISPRAHYHVPGQVGKTIVQELPGFMPQSEYLKCLEQMNILIAPRLSEGVGITTLEALARGCAVFAYNAPTMNEYITSNYTGFLLSNINSSLGAKLKCNTRRIIGKLRYPHQHFHFPVSEYQNWKTIQKLNLQQIGDAAREEHEKGYKHWQTQIGCYAHFLLDWS